MCIILLGYSGKQGVVQEASDFKKFYSQNLLIGRYFVSKTNSVCLDCVVFKTSLRFMHYNLLLLGRIMEQ